MDTSSQRGSILIYSLIMMSAMLALSLALTGLLVARLRVSIAARSTAIAVDVADSAAEKCLYEARHGSAMPALTFQPGAMYMIASASATPVDITADCSVLKGSFTIRATGTFNGVRRTFEITQ